MRRIALLIIVILLPILSYGYNNGKLIGSIVDKSTGERLPGVNIFIKKLKIGTSTGNRGEYILKNIPRGDYKLTISSIGYKTKTVRVKISKKLLTKLNFKLESETQSLKSVEVTAKSKIQKMREAPEAISVIDAKELHGKAVSLESVLDKSLGIKIRQSGGLGSSSRIVVHGLEGKRVQVLLDGDPLNSPDGSISINDIPIDLIERIDIYKGIVPARFGGDGLGGAVNVVIREFDTDYMDLAFERSSYNTNRGTWVFKKNFPEQGILIGTGGFYNYSDNNYTFNSPYEDGLKIKRDHDVFESYIFSGSIKFTKLWFDEVEFEINQYNNYKEIQGIQKNIQHAHIKSNLFALELSLEKEDFFIENLDFDYLQLYGKARSNYVDTSHFEYDFQGKKRDSQSGRGEIGWNPNDSDDLVVENRQRLNMNYEINKNHNLNWNTSLRHFKKSPEDELASNKLGYDIGGYPSEMFSMVSGLSHESRYFDGKIMNILGGKVFYIDSEVLEINKYGTTKKPKTNSNSSTNYGFSEAIRWKPIPEFNIKASYQMAVRLPVSHELFGDGVMIEPPSKLKPERSQNINIGILYDREDLWGLPRLQVEVNAFHMQLRDMIKLMKGTMRFGYTNLGEVEIKGIEAEIKSDITDNLYLFGNITYQDARDRQKHFDGTNDINPTKGKRVPNIPYFFANWGVEYHKNNLFGKDQYTKIFYDTQFTHDYYYNWKMNNDPSRIIKGNLIHNIGIQQSFHKNRYTASFEIHNIADTEAWNIYKMPLMGRSIHFKLRYTLTKKVK